MHPGILGRATVNLPQHTTKPSVFSPSHELLRGVGGAHRRDFQDNLLAFCRALRTVIPNVTAGRIIDAVRSLGYVDISNKIDFHNVLKSNLLSSHEDEEAFDSLYELFWQPLDANADARRINRSRQTGDETRIDIPVPDDPYAQNQVRYQTPEAATDEDGDGSSNDADALAYSPNEVLAAKNFEDYTEADVAALRRVLDHLAPKLATMLSRRTKSSFNGPQIDLRRSFRNSLRYGGEVMQLARKQRKVRKLNITLLCDVSGSMDRYSRFLLQFMYGLENQMTGVHAWVFSTRLTEVTDFLRRRSYQESLDAIAQSVHDWSGGTTIGTCLRQFAADTTHNHLNRRSVVIVMSDGWDRGDVELLDKAMRSLKRQTQAIIWLNPLLGNPSYQPLCAGIRAALPHSDYFLPAHNLDSLIKLTKTLNTMSRTL